jgi:hypothetical protein
MQPIATASRVEDVDGDAANNRMIGPYKIGFRVKVWHTVAALASAHFRIWMQGNKWAAILSLAAFPMHYYPATARRAL